jgi:ABC-type glycerol-3-phosphate transport system substrate-binding protein
MSLRNSRRGSRSRALPLVTAVLLGLVACGGGGDDASGEPAAPTELPSDLDEDVAAAAEAAADKGMLFLTSHDEIVEMAKEAGPLNGYVSSDVAEDIAAAFTEATGVEATLEDFSGTDAYQRFLLEADAGQLQDIDIQQAPPELYTEFRELMAPYDIYGMAEAGILDIPVEMIDPENRNVVAVGSQIAGYAYNPDMVDEGDIPTDWEGFCDTGFLDGAQYMLDLRPSNIAPLVEQWGMERVLEMTDCLVATDPILTRGTTDALTRVTAGEVPMHVFTNYHSTIRAMEEAGGNLEVGLIEPVPVRLSNALGVMGEDVANNPAASLLLIEFLASEEGQALLDADPLKSSIYSEFSQVREAIGDREYSGGDWESYAQMEGWMDEIATRMGVPQ